MQSYDIFKFAPGRKPKRGQGRTLIGSVEANRPATALRAFDASIKLDSKAPNKGRLEDGTRVVAIRGCR